MTAPRRTVALIAAARSAPVVWLTRIATAVPSPIAGTITTIWVVFAIP